MSEWKEYKLGEIAEIKGGKRLPKGELLVDYETPHPYIRVTDMGKKWIRKSGLQFVTPKVQKTISRYVVNSGDVILSIVGSIGLVGRISQELNGANLTENCVKLLTNKTIVNDDFLFYFLISDEGQYEIEKRNVGSTQPKLPLYNIKDIDIFLPPLPEQKAIAEVLSSLDDKIDLLTRQNNTLEDLGQAFFRKWFVADADEKLKKYPLSELMVIQNGFAFRSRDYQDAGKYKIVTIKNVQDGFIDTSGTTFLNQLPVGMPDYVLLTIGDVLISLTGNVGRVGIVVEDNLLLNQRVAKISPYNPEYLPFLYFYFRNETTREYLINLAHGTAQANLSPIETLKTEVSFSKTLIKKYSELFMPMYQKIIKNKQQIIVLQKLRDTLLPKLISGEVRVKL